MAKLTPHELKQLSNDIFKNHWPMVTLWQTIADHFYAERADFTVTRNFGQELADNLVDSYPLLVRRDLGNSLSAMLRDGDWFRMGVNSTPDHLGQIWLDQSTQRLKSMMYHRTANFVRSTREGDHDYIAFGQCVISVKLNRKASGLLYQCWHMKDVAWFDDESGQIGGVSRKWKPTYRQVVDYFGKAAPERIIDELTNTPFKAADIRHIVVPSVMYGDDDITERFPWVSIYLDIDAGGEVIEAVGMTNQEYVIPRFQTIAGSPYAYSPATVVGLPDARCIQAMTHTLLEAGERYARPPIIATQKVIRGDVDLAPDGITWVDDEYDERLGAALRPMAQDRGGFPVGLEMRDGIYEILNRAFYLNTMQLPDINREMTAYEVSERMKQFRRENLPLFAPIEAEYSGAICELSFEVAMNAGFLGSPYDIPESLRDSEVLFKFESPLSRAEEEEKATRFGQTAAILSQAAEFDQGVAANVNFDVAVQDAIIGVGAPAKWLNNPEQVQQGRMKDSMMQLAESGALDNVQEA